MIICCQRTLHLFHVTRQNHGCVEHETAQVTAFRVCMPAAQRQLLFSPHLWSQRVVIYKLKCAYYKCMKIFSYDRRYRVTQLLLELGLPSRSTLITNIRSVSVKSRQNNCKNRLIISFVHARFIIVYLYVFVFLFACPSVCIIWTVVSEINLMTNY